MDDHGRDFLPIEGYGIIGNLHTAALVSKEDASIDHFCFPTFDSPLIFGRLLTRMGGGFFELCPVASKESHWTSKQLYLPSSNVIVTRFLGAEGGIGQVTDLLPVTKAQKEDKVDTRFSFNEGLLRSKNVKGWPWLVRRVETVRGRIHYRVQCQPAFDYGRESHEVRILEDGAVLHFLGKSLNLELRVVTYDERESKTCDKSPKPLKHIQWNIIQEQVDYKTGLTVDLPKAVGDFCLNEHQSYFFVLRELSKNDPPLNAPKLLKLISDTNNFWHSWIAKCTYRGRWREMVQRSALVLKLLTYAPTGAIVAAATTSLPEELGGSKNWDYRFTWIRDAAFTVYAFLRIGLTEEAADFQSWIEQRCREVVDDPVGLRLMYDIRGGHPAIPDSSSTTDGREKSRHALDEIILDHWTGYRDSYPVRIGNLAAHQQQLDIYGELMDAIYLCDKWVRPVSYDFWQVIRDSLIPQVLQRWPKPDHGIWEVRDKPQHHVYSKIMCWVALDRACRLALKRSLPAPLVEWREQRDKIYESVMKEGYSEKLKCFTQYYGSDALDASNLIIPLVFFMPADDPRFLRTIEKTLLPPGHGGLTINHLVFRFHPKITDEDDQPPEGTFTICSFWLVEALARAGVRNPELLQESSLIFEDIIGYANHLGLFSEEIGLNGSALGNFPQAFTHLSLISAAFNLDRALG
eukprot:TRINITY_DN1344_c0_g2_i1.p1 TRINITY_DN1344_c0_g2~~TRINITY_DN1344_c0_g2_i1.p1  ORF type:complete len:689 (+),score=134.30 TRINITY_DN1344_c0_g2_i1:119-2185(+)